jgi:hypothetical protein
MKKPFRIIFSLLLFASPLASAETAAPSAGPMNQFSGTVAAVDDDAGLLRLAIDGGYNVELKFDYKTTVTDGNQSIKTSDLSYGDKVVARYVGKELYAKQILRNPSSAASGSAPAAAETAASTTTAPSVVSSVTTPTH